MAIEKRLIEFSDDDIDEVCVALGSLRKGEWCNVEPFVDQRELDELRARSPHPLLRMFMKAGAPIPLGTVMREANGFTLGLEHSHAARAIPYLREQGVETPRAWKIKQDHARRGIVLSLPAEVVPSAMVLWVLASARVLSSVRLGSAWTALVCTPK